MDRIAADKYVKRDVETISALLNSAISGPVVLPIAIAPPQKSIA
jgi:hypothetical protein